MAVEFDRSLIVAAAPEQIWGRIFELDCIAGWVPIIEDVEEIEHESVYEAVLTDALGPFKLSADLEIKITAREFPTLLGFEADGEDRQIGSRIWVNANLDLQSDNGGGTQLRFHGSYEVTGRVATLGSSMIKTKATHMLDAFAAGALQEFG